MTKQFKQINLYKGNIDLQALKLTSFLNFKYHFYNFSHSLLDCVVMWHPDDGGSMVL